MISGCHQMINLIDAPALNPALHDLLGHAITRRELARTDFNVEGHRSHQLHGVIMRQHETGNADRATISTSFLLDWEKRMSVGASL